MSRLYAGIGSRETPVAMLGLMEQLAGELAAAGWCLRSGAADGADSAFERGARSEGGDQEIFLPWRTFRGHKTGIDASTLPTAAAAEAMARDLHSAWHRLDEFGRKLMTRNVMQVLGADLESPVRFVVCWAKGSRFKGDRVVDVVGGTGLAVRLAAARGIEVFNLSVDDHHHRIEQWMNNLAAERNSAPRP